MSMAPHSLKQGKAGHHEAHAEPGHEPHAVDGLCKVLEQAALVEEQHQVVEAGDIAVLRQDGQHRQHRVDVWVLEHQQSCISACSRGL